MRFLARVVLAVYLIEAGLILIASPWATTWWQRNYFADVVPWLRVLMTTAGMHAVAMAVGVVTMAVGIADLWQVLSGRFSQPPPDVSAPDL